LIIRDYISFFSRCWPLLVFGVITVFLGNFGQSFFISWYGTSFQQSLELSATGYGSVYSVSTLASGLLLMWIGAAIDTIPLRWFIGFVALDLSVATLILCQVSNVVGLVIGLFMLRFFGQGLLPHTAITTMTREFSIHRGKAVSIATSGVPFGEILLHLLQYFLLLRLVGRTAGF
jgi:MFS family permease